MAKAFIGGAIIEVALPNFKMLKRAWRHINAATLNIADSMSGVDAILAVIAIGDVAGPAKTDGDIAARVDQLEEQMTPVQMIGLRTFMNELLIETGLAKPPGEAKPAGETANPSTETLTP